MRNSIFTNAERRAIKDHLDGKPVNPNFWGVLVHRIKRNNLSILEEVDLMLKVLNVLKLDEEEAP